MMESNLSILANWLLAGMEAIRYQPSNNFVLLFPEAHYDEDYCADDSYCIPITDSQVVDMLSGVDGTKFYAFVTSEC